MKNRLKMSDILKPGAKLEAILLTDEEIKATVQKAEKAQAEVRKLKQIDWAKLQNTFITI